MCGIRTGGLQGSNWYDSSDKGLTTGDNANTLVKALAGCRHL